MANQFSAGQGVMQRDTYIDNLDKAIDLLWMRKDRHEGVLGKYFEDVNVNEGMSYKISSVSSIVGLPRENEDTEALPYVQPAPGFDKTFNMVVYRSGIRVTDTMVRADRFGRIVGMANGMIKSAMRKMEYLRAAVINGAFSGTAGADSLSLCNNSHPHENPEAGTWDNLYEGALTGAGLQAGRLIHRKQTNEGGYPDAVMPTDILIPPDLEQKANELTRSVKRAEDALNAETQLISNLNITVSPFITDTDSWFLFGDLTGEEKGLMTVSLMTPQMANNSPANADIVIDKRVKFITTVGYTTSKNVVGSAGA